MQHGGRVQRGASRHADALDFASAAVQVADDNGDAVEALGREVTGKLVHRPDGCIDERLTERQVLDRVPGQHHLREDDDARALLRRAHGPLDHFVAIASEVADSGIDLSESDPKLRHVLSLIGRRGA